MNLLIGGAADKGKTSAIRRITEYLINQKGFEILDNVIIPENVEGEKPEDYTIQLKGLDNSSNIIIIIINTASDNYEIIDNLKSYLNNKQLSHILISSVRDLSHIRDYFYAQIIMQNDFTLEFPLAKINYNWGKREKVIERWYNPNIDAIIQHILSHSPFNL